MKDLYYNVKDIEKLYMPEDIIAEIKNQNSKLQIRDFFTQDDESFDIEYYGIYVITPIQDFSCIARERHEDVMTNILFALYGDDYNETMRKCNCDWIATANSLNNVVVQIMSKRYCLIWIPDKINKFQRDKLMELYNLSIEVNENLAKNGQGQITFTVGLKNQSGELISCMFDESLSLLDDRVSYDLPIRDEPIIDNGSSYSK